MYEMYIHRNAPSRQLLCHATGCYATIDLLHRLQRARPLLQGDRSDAEISHAALQPYISDEMLEKAITNKVTRALLVRMRPAPAVTCACCRPGQQQLAIIFNSM